MKKGIALIVALLIACSFPVAMAEESGSELIVAVGGQFTTLDPALNTEVINGYALDATVATLFSTDENNNAVPNLCESYEVSEDGLTYTLHLAEGAQWSDGEPITADNFVYSYLRTISYGADNSYAANTMIDYIAGADAYNILALEAGTDFDCTVEDASSVGVKALDDLTLELTLSKPCPYFTKILTGTIWGPSRPDFAPQHESLWAFDAGYPCSGPYILVECNENEKCVLTKNPNYFKADEVTLENIVFQVMTDQAAQAMAFQTEAVDIALSISSETALQYEGSDSLSMIARSSNYFLAINSGSTGPDWAKDVKIRRALALAIDKDALVEVLGGPALYPPLNGYVPTGLGGLNGDFRAEADADGYTLTYDPEQAKALLAEAGYDESNPLEITYKYSNNSVHGDVATMLQSMWQAIGVNVTFDAVESGVFYDQVDQGQFEICRYGYVASNDAMDYLKIWNTSTQIVAAVDDPVYDQKIEDATWITDPTEYYTKLHEIEDYLCDENVYLIPLFNYNTPVLISPSVTGWRVLGGSLNYEQVTIAE